MPVRQALEVPGRYGFHSTRPGHPPEASSSSYEGMKATVAKVLKSSWQRCCFDFMRNALAHAAIPGGASSPPSLPKRLPRTMPRLARRSGARSPISSAPSCRRLLPFSTRRRRTCSPTRPPAEAPDQAALHQPYRAPQGRDQAAHRGGRHLSQRERHRSPHRRDPARTKR